MEKDLKVIKKAAHEKHDENWDFRSFLKQLDMTVEEMDAVVHRIYHEVIAQIDCTRCGNCCKHVRPVLDPDDVARFAEGLNISANELEEKYLTQSKRDPSNSEFNTLPCPFLSNNKCTKYEHRPKSCASFPHLHKDEFVFRLIGVIENYACCPIVYNVYERLKDELWHPDKLDEEDLY